MTIYETYVHIHVKDEVSVTNYMDRRAYKRKVPKWLSFENLEVSSAKKSNQHTLGASTHICTKDEVFMTIVNYLLTANQRKVPKCLSFTSYKSQ